MSKLVNKYAVVATVLAVLAIIAFMALHASCHAGAYSICLLTVCAFILASTGIWFSLGATLVTVNVPAHRGVSVPLRLERPPRT